MASVHSHKLMKLLYVVLPIYLPYNSMQAFLPCHFSNQSYFCHFNERSSFCHFDEQSEEKSYHIKQRFLAMFEITRVIHEMALTFCHFDERSKEKSYLIIYRNKS